MATQAGLAKGTRDFFGDELSKRQFMIAIIEKHFKRFGFSRIETPSFENYATLMGKYGDEGDRLIFKILKSGDYLAKADISALEAKDSQALTSSISDKALRYDLTVPFARFVVQHQNELAFPFKRYQIQPVWRADRPQKGRFREFTQCDADVVGADSLWQEVELLQLYNAIFSELGLKEKHKVTVKLNNRKLLSGIAEAFGIGDRLSSFVVTLDKLDKIGSEGVAAELNSQGFDPSIWETLASFLDHNVSVAWRLERLRKLFTSSEIGTKGIEEMQFVLDQTAQLSLASLSLSFDLTLARGLHYYTGTLFEVSAPNGVQLGAIGGGGRYDDLTSAFGGKDLSGVGISFGLDRIYLVLEELGLFPSTIGDQIDVLVLHLTDTNPLQALQLVNSLRFKGVSSEFYPEASKPAKQYKYAEKRKALNVAYWNTEAATWVIKNMKTSEQQEFQLESLQTILPLKRE
jgi:histidyl-tRNA synthetase